MIAANANLRGEDSYSTDDFQDQHEIYWSDLANGCSVETFAPYNREIVGKSNEGEITGVFGGTTRLTILKQSQVYYLEGTLISGGYKIYSSLSNGIGCIAHRSIVEFDGGCLFLSSKGIYYCNGTKPKEMTYSIEPLLTSTTLGWDKTRCLAVNFVENERMVFYIPNLTTPANDRLIVLDYTDEDTKEWYVWSGWDCRAGLVYERTSSGSNLYFSNATTVKKTNATNNDDLVAINAKYRTSFWTLGSPALKKKFNKLSVLSLENLSWACGVKVYVEYSNTAHQTLTPKNFSSGVNVLDFPLPSANVKAVSFEISNNTAGQPMSITGLELEYNRGQQRVTGDDA
jgi:hypothetical protein